ADGEANHGCADDQLAPVLANLAAPVGQLTDAVAERLDGLAELLPLDLDVTADLVRGPARRSGGRTRDGLAGAGAVDPGCLAHDCPVRVSLVRRASSIASSGTGGAPARTDRYAIRPAMPATTNQKIDSTMKPI